MPRYALTIAYDGTDFCGWQKQEPPADPPPGATIPGPHKVAESLEPARPGRIALRSVQAVVEDATRSAVREPVSLKGASRTDAGVHARCQVAAFTSTPDPERGVGWPAERGPEPLRRAINSRLPGDVLVARAQIVHDQFDPITDCTSKGYSYSIIASPDRPVFERRYAAHVRHALDPDAMNEAAAHITGQHDFAAFAATGHGRQSTIRTVFDCTVSNEPGPTPARGTSVPPVATDPSQSRGTGVPPVTPPAPQPFPPQHLRIHISGSGFLYNMVRIIAGTLVEVGRGKMSPRDVPAILDSLDRRRAGPTMPPRGLCLDWIDYTPDQ